MYKLTISVITYNRANYLKEMLDSILQQTYSEFYVKIYDNCSDDNTEEVVKPYLSDARFSYHRHSTIIDNGNYALKNCETDYLLIAHDDDIMLPDMIKEEISVLEQYDNVSLVSTNVNQINTNGDFINYAVFNKWMNGDCFINCREYINIFVDKANIIACPTVMYRMSVIRKHNIQFRTDIGGVRDSFLWLELNQLNYSFFYISKVLYNYRIHNTQDSRTSPFLTSFLRKPVYNLLSENNYSKKIKKKWLNHIDYSIAREIYEDKYSNFQKIKDCILFHNRLDFVLHLKIIYKLYMPNFAKKFITFLRKIK